VSVVEAPALNRDFGSKSVGCFSFFSLNLIFPISLLFKWILEVEIQSMVCRWLSLWLNTGLFRAYAAVGSHLIPVTKHGALTSLRHCVIKRSHTFHFFDINITIIYIRIFSIYNCIHCHLADGYLHSFRITVEKSCSVHSV